MSGTIGYARDPGFEVHSPNKLSLEERIVWALSNRKAFKDACENEGVDLRSAEKIVKRFERKLVEKKGNLKRSRRTI